VDWIAEKTEARGSDFWLDYEAGILFLGEYGSMVKGVRIKFRYGETVVPYDVEECATKLAAMNVMRSGYFGLTPQGNDYLSMQSKPEMLRKETDMIISRRAEFVII